MEERYVKITACDECKLMKYRWLDDTNYFFCSNPLSLNQTKKGTFIYIKDEKYPIIPYISSTNLEIPSWCPLPKKVTE